MKNKIYNAIRESKCRGYSEDLCRGKLKGARGRIRAKIKAQVNRELELI